MTVQDANMERPAEVRRDAAGRVVEWEIKMPSLGKVKTPELDLEPARRAAEKVLLVGIGAGVLVARGIVARQAAADLSGVAWNFRSASDLPLRQAARFCPYLQ